MATPTVGLPCRIRRNTSTSRTRMSFWRWRTRSMRQCRLASPRPMQGNGTWRRKWGTHTMLLLLLLVWFRRRRDSPRFFSPSSLMPSVRQVVPFLSRMRRRGPLASPARPPTPTPGPLECPIGIIWWKETAADSDSMPGVPFPPLAATAPAFPTLTPPLRCPKGTTPLCVPPRARLRLSRSPITFSFSRRTTHLLVLPPPPLFSSRSFRCFGVAPDGFRGGRGGGGPCALFLFFVLARPSHQLLLLLRCLPRHGWCSWNTPRLSTAGSAHWHPLTRRSRRT